VEVNESGRTVTLDNGLVLDLPPGTVSGSGSIQVHPVPLAARDQEYPFTGPVQGTIYQIAFEQVELMAPLQVSFPLPEDINPQEYDVAVYGYDPRRPFLQDPILGIASPPIWSPLPSIISGRRVSAWIDSGGWVGLGWTWKGGHASLGMRLEETYPGGDLPVEVHGQVCVDRNSFRNRPSVEVENRVTVLVDRSDGLGQAFNSQYMDLPIARANRPVTVSRPEDPNALYQCVPETFHLKIPLHEYLRPRERQVNLYARFEIELVEKEMPSIWTGRSNAYRVLIDRPGQLELVPTSAPPAAPIRVTGSAYLPDELVDLWWDLGNHLAPIPIPARADAEGGLSIALTAPKEISAISRVRLVGRGQTSGWTGEAVLQVMREDSGSAVQDDPDPGSRPCLRITPTGGDESRSVVLLNQLEESSLTVTFDVEDQCSRTNPPVWEIFPPAPVPPFDLPDDPDPFGEISLSADGKLAVHLDPEHIPAGVYKKVIGLRYPGQIVPSLTILQVQVIDQPYLLPSSWSETRQVVYEWGKDGETRGECRGIRTTDASGSPSSRWVSETVKTAWEGECVRNNDMHTNVIDRLTGLEVSTSCFNCFPRHLGPQPAEGQILLDGMPIPVFTRHWPWYGQQEALTGDGFWESEGAFQVQYHAATGIYLDLEYRGKLFFTGGTEKHGYHGQWESQQVTLTQTSFPYGLLPDPAPAIPGCLAKVPNVQGRNAWEAGEFLRRVGYGFIWDTIDLAGQVLSQDPPAGACSPPGQTVVRLTLMP
jgi:hypothetical protein